METTEKSYELRRLNASDIFMMSKILSSIGIKEFKNCFDREKVKKLVSEANEAAEAVETTGNEEAEADAKPDTRNDDIATAVGMSVMFDMACIILENLYSCEKYVYEFLANLSGMKAAEIAALPPDVFAEMVIDVFRKDEFRDFMKVVSRSFR